MTLDDLYDMSQSDALPVSRSVAMSLPVVAAARRWVAAIPAVLPLVARNAAGVLASQPYAASQPDPGRTNVIHRTWTYDSMFFYGRAWWLALDSAPVSGRYSRFRVIPESLLRWDQAGEVTHVGDMRLTDPARLIRIDGPHEGVLTTGSAAIRDALDTTASSRRARRNPVPSIELHQAQQNPSITPEQKERLLADWTAARKGTNGGVAFTSWGIETKTHGQAPEQLLIEGKRDAALDLARACGVPAWCADLPMASSNLTYANLEARNREVVETVFGPYLAALTERLSMDDISPHGTWIEPLTTDFTRGDLKSRAESYAAAVASGVWTVEDCHDLEHGLPQERT